MRIIALLVLLCSNIVFAEEQYPFSNPAQKAQFIHLTQNLRCMVCQHQNLAESDAPLARDMKQYVYEQVQLGVSDQDIQHYLVARYGDKILFKPPVKPLTWALWLAPFLLFCLGIWVFFRLVAKRGQV